MAEAVLMARAFTDCLGVAVRAALRLVFDRRRCEEEWLVRLFRWPARLQIGSALRRGWPLAPPPCTLINPLAPLSCSIDAVAIRSGSGGIDCPSCGRAGGVCRLPR